MKLITKKQASIYKKISVKNIKKIDKTESIQMYSKRVAKYLSNLLGEKNYIDVDEINYINKNKLITFLIFKELSFLSENITFSSNKNINNILIYQGNNIIDIDRLKVLRMVRDFQDIPQNILTPKKYSEMVIENFGSAATILSEKETSKMGLFHAVGDSSINKPKFVVIKHIKKNDVKPIILVGKGVTYDSGGYNLKSGKNLLGMKADMSGSAVVLGIMELLKRKKIKANVIAIIPMVENVIGSKSFMPQMIIKSFDKTYVEIKNTDAEGRLINADAISYGIHKFKPKYVIEVSTLVGSITQSISNLASGVFSNNKKLIYLIKKSGDIAGERFVSFENFPELRNRLYSSSSIADIANVDLENKMNAQYAFEFLNHFAKNIPFMHIDIAGTAVSKRDRGTGESTLSIYELIKLIK